MKKYYYLSRRIFREGTLEVEGRKVKFPKEIYGYCPIWKKKKDALKSIPAEFINKVMLGFGEKEKK